MVNCEGTTISIVMGFGGEVSIFYFQTEEKHGIRQQRKTLHDY
jgi:hypothetical protein